MISNVEETKKIQSVEEAYSWDFDQDDVPLSDKVVALFTGRDKVAKVLQY